MRWRSVGRNTVETERDSDDGGIVNRDTLRGYHRWNSPRSVRGVRKQDESPALQAGGVSSVALGVVSAVGQQLRVGARLLVQERRDLVGLFLFGSVAGHVVVTHGTVAGSTGYT